MRLVGKPQRSADHDNAFGFLRLLFASLVIATHTAEIVDGSRSREPLAYLFGEGAAGLGDLAVNGFFIISGFLITASALQSSSWRSYFKKRIFRIYPAFLVAFIVCLLIAPLAGGDNELASLRTISHSVKNALLLREPYAEGAFSTHPRPELNKSLWTIPYEFRCYILAFLLAACGLLRRPIVPAVACLVLLFLGALLTDGWATWLSGAPLSGLWLGDPKNAFRMTAMFLAGSAFYGWRHAIPMRADLVLLSIAGLLGALATHRFEELACALGGSYLIFTAASAGAKTRLKDVNNREDISYGLYLYGWPIEQLLLLYMGTSSLLVLGLSTWILALMAGAISWFVLEKPIMKAIRPKPR